MITIQDHGKVRELRLDRPPVNALSPDLINALKSALEAAPKEGAHAIVLSGRPGMFSAGLDVPLLLTLDPPAIANVWRDLYGLLAALACSPVPIAAAITGHAPAGGTVLAVFCDWRVAAQGDWKMGVNEVRVGLPLPPIIFSALHRLLGAHRAQQLAVSGALFSPQEGKEIGLIDEVAPPGGVIGRAIEWCQEQVALPPTAMAYTRRRARADLVAIFQRDLGPELAEITAIWWADEAQNTLRALTKKLGKS